MSSRGRCWIFGVMCALLAGAAGAGYSVEPETTSSVVFSNLDVNRLVCDAGNITDVFYSQEKGVVVTTMGRNAFVKTKMKRKLDTGELIRPVLNLDLHVVCAGQVYTLIGALKPVPAQTIHLTDHMGKVRENIRVLGAMPREKRIETIMLAAYKNDYPDSFEVEPKLVAYAEMGSTIIDRVRRIRIEGLGLRLTEYKVSVTGDTQLTERDFLKPEFGRHIEAISIDSKGATIRKGTAVRVFVLERVDHEQE